MEGSEWVFWLSTWIFSLGKWRRHRFYTYWFDIMVKKPLSYQSTKQPSCFDVCAEMCVEVHANSGQRSSSPRRGSRCYGECQNHFPDLSINTACLRYIWMRNKSPHYFFLREYGVTWFRRRMRHKSDLFREAQGHWRTIWLLRLRNVRLLFSLVMHSCLRCSGARDTLTPVDISNEGFRTFF